MNALFHFRHLKDPHTTAKVPSIPDIQAALVKMEDKPKSIIGSRDWIGSFEVMDLKRSCVSGSSILILRNLYFNLQVCLIIDQVYDIPSKIIHIPRGRDLVDHFDTIKGHFSKSGSPCMMGGDNDASSKGIFGVCESAEKKYLLIVDPHYWGSKISDEALAEHDWVRWRELGTFVESSFYNLCLPQIKHVKG